MVHIELFPLYEVQEQIKLINSDGGQNNGQLWGGLLRMVHEGAC